MKRGFVISWFFPPINSSEGVVTYKLLKNSSLNYTVFTQNKRVSWSYGNDDRDYSLPNVDVVTSTTGELTDWVQEGIRYFDEHKDEFSFIMSRSMAPEGHEIALAIKKKYPEVKWIASFGDPIAHNPYQLLMGSPNRFSIKGKKIRDVGIRRYFSPIRFVCNILWKLKHGYKTKEERLEDETIRLADRIILNNPYQQEYMMKEYPKEIQEKVWCIPHTFDEGFYGEDKPKEDDKIHFVYTGLLDHIRTSIPLLKAIGRMNRNYPSIMEKVSFDFYGNIGDFDKIEIMNEEIFNIVHLHKPVGYFESLQEMKRADWLLMIDANLGTVMNEGIFFPGKLADYIGSKTPIFCITMDSGASNQIIRDTNGVLMSHSVDEIYMNLYRILVKGYCVEMRNQEGFNAKNVAKQFDDNVMKGLV